MFAVLEINGDRPLLTPENVVPNFLRRHPPLHVAEVIRPLRIYTEELGKKERVKRVKRSACVSSCPTYNCFTNVNKRRKEWLRPVCMCGVTPGVGGLLLVGRTTRLLQHLRVVRWVGVP
jgi:hypothetical protein